MSGAAGWVAVFGILTTAVIYGTDIFFLTVAGPALKLVSPDRATEIMGFIHSYGDERMPTWGVLAILSNLWLALFEGEHRVLHLASLTMLILFVVLYNRLSKPINRIQTEAAKTRRTLENAQELQAAWDRSLMLRTPLLIGSLLIQCLTLFGPL